MLRMFRRLVDRAGRLAGLTAACVAGSTWILPARAASTGASFFDLKLRELRYLGDAQQSAQLQSYTILSGDLNIETQSPGFNYKMEPVFQGAIEAPTEMYFGIPEFYVQPRKIAPGFNLTIGRQRRLWSRLDEEFNLGIWQPQLRWDYLQPVQQGLTGVFFDWSLSSALRFSFFTSPLFLPDQGPQFSLKDGHFRTANRWFSPPQSRVDLFPNTPLASAAPLYFKLQRPSEEDIVMHSSFGFAVNYQSAGPFWSQFSYAYKPRNQIHLGIECANCASIPNGNIEITAVLHPKIVNHNVITWEGGFDRVDDKGWLSLTGDAPLKSGFPSAYAEAPLNSMVIAGFGYQHYVRPWFGLPSWLEYSYMRIFEFKRKSDNGLVPDDSVQSSLDRYPYSEVAAIDWRILFTQKQRRRLQFRNRYTYSFPERGGWWSSNLEWTDGPWSYGLGGDVLGAAVDPNSAEAGMFSRYRANDRVHAGVRYVF